MQFIRQNLGTCQITAICKRNPTKPSPAITPAKSHASRVRLTHFRWVSRSHSAQWKSHAFSCSTKNNIFNVTSVLLLWWEMRVLTPVLLLLTLGLLIFMCGSIRHTAQWQCPGSKLVHSKWLVSTRSWQHIDTIYGLWHCVHLYTRGWQHWYRASDW